VAQGVAASVAGMGMQFALMALSPAEKKAIRRVTSGSDKDHADDTGPAWASE
jgi:hypothetical protein